MDKYQTDFCNSRSNNIRLLAPAGSGKTTSILHRCKKIINDSKSYDEALPQILIITFTNAAANELHDRVQTLGLTSEQESVIRISTLNSWGYDYIQKHNSLNSFSLIKSNNDSPTSTQSVSVKSCFEDTRCKSIIQGYTIIEEMISRARYKNTIYESFKEISDLLKASGFRHDKIKSDEDLQKQIGLYNYPFFELKLIELWGAISPDIEAISVETILGNFSRFWVEMVPFFFNNGWITFEDQKYWANILLEKDAYQRNQQNINHIIIDEFQDINMLDLNLIKAIADNNRATLTIVGDDDQAIYEWRGSRPDFIIKPENFFRSAFESYQLYTNYRSAPNILSYAQALISQNINRVEKNHIRAHRTDDALIGFIRNRGTTQSIQEVLCQIENLISKDHSIALIARKRSQLLPYQILLADKNIPYTISPDHDISASESFTSLIELLRVKNNAKEEIFVTSSAMMTLLDAVLRYPISAKYRNDLYRYLNERMKVRLQKFQEMEEKDPVKYHNVKRNLNHLHEWNIALRILSLYVTEHDNLIANQQFNRNALNIALKGIGEFIKSEKVTDILSVLQNSFGKYKPMFGTNTEDIFRLDPPFYYLQALAERYDDDLNGFIENLEKIGPNFQNNRGTSDSEDSQTRVTVNLMTAHGAKGREFDSVVILGANDNIWPNPRAYEGFSEQERRLFYVAMTRARKYLLFEVCNTIGFPNNYRRVDPSPYFSQMGLDIPPITL